MPETIASIAALVASTERLKECWDRLMTDARRLTKEKAQQKFSLRYFTRR
jgi:hypothetical protein